MRSAERRQVQYSPRLDNLVIPCHAHFQFGRHRCHRRFPGWCGEVVLQQQGVTHQRAWLTWMLEQGFDTQVSRNPSLVNFLEEHQLELTVDQLEITSNQFRSHESIRNVCSWRAHAHCMFETQP